MSFTNLILTAGGKGIYAKAELGQGLHFSRVAVGDGVLNGPTTSRTALVREKMSLAIDGKRLVNDGTETAIITTMDNKDLAEGFFYREVGIFATDPDSGAEVLCLYDNAGADAEEIPPGTLKQVYERLVFILRLDSTKDVTFTWSGNPLYLTQEEIAAALADKADLDPATGKVKLEQMPYKYHATTHAVGGEDALTPGDIGTYTKEEINASLSNTASVRYASYTSLNELLTVPSGFYHVYPPATNMPMSGFWYCIVCSEQPGSGTRIIYAMPAGTLNDSLWKIRCTGGVPESWKEVATATPPQKLAFPLASGVTAYSASYYIKTQESVVILNVGVQTTLPDGPIAIGTLPIGYRPPDTVICGANNAVYLAVDPDGGIRAHCVHGAVVQAVVPFLAASYGTNAPQSQVRMSVAKAARSAISLEPVVKCMCVVDADGVYVEFVQVTITYDKLGALYTVYCYDVKDGEHLVDAPPPPRCRYAGAPGLVRPKWEEPSDAWVEGASAAELSAWELEHPAPNPVTPAPTTEELAEENKLLRARVNALTEQNDFQEELIVELAGVVYA